MVKKLPSLQQEFDVVITDKHGCQVPANCVLTLPTTGWDGAEVHLSIPHAIMPIHDMLNPCKVEGQDSWGRQIAMDEVWYREITTMTHRQSGLAPIVLSHIGKISSVDKNQGSDEHPGMVEISFVLGRNEFLHEYWPQKRTQHESGQVDHLFKLVVDELGEIQFIRKWGFARAASELEVTLRCGLQAIILLDEKNTHFISETHVRFKDALVVLSILCRQRIHILGFMNRSQHQLAEEWIAPLDPLETKHMEEGREKYLVPANDFASVSEIAIQKYLALSAPIKKVLQHISIGLAPYLEYRAPERFLVMFNALEGCRKFAVETLPPDLAEENSKLLSALKGLRACSEPCIAQRLEGFEKTIGKGKLSLSMQLEQVLNTWKVEVADLWPISGNEKHPGLKDIRDLLSHKGAIAVDHQALTVAAWHLSIILERIVIALLGVPIEKTRVTHDALGNEMWYQPTFINELQRRAKVTN